MDTTGYFHTDPVAALSDPVAWMEMARDLRRAADRLESEVVAAARFQFEQWRDRQVGIEQCEDDCNKELEAKKDRGMARVAQMLYQMSYENALKGIRALQSLQPSTSHSLEVLAAEVGLVVDEIDQQYLAWLTKMNQLGRYKLRPHKEKLPDGTKEDRHDYHVTWTTQYAERRAAVDQAIADLWIRSRGPLESAWLTENENE